MNKVTFEKELSRKLSGLSNSERQKILDYYDELYYEKLESGESESEIIKSFGTPAEVAERVTISEGILEDFVGSKEDSEGKSVFSRSEEVDMSASTSVFTQTASKVKSAVGGIFARKTFWVWYFILWFVTIPLTVALFSVVFSLAVSVVAVVVSLFAAGIAMVVAGPGYLIYGTIVAFTNPAAGVAHIGLGLACLALGILFVKSFSLLKWLCIKLFVSEEKRKNMPEKKRKSFKWGYVCVALFLVSGAAVFVTGFAIADWDYHKLNTTAMIAFSENGEQTVNKLEIEVDNRSIEVIASGDGWRVEAQSPKDCDISAVFEEGTLKIVDRCNSHHQFNWQDLFNAFSGAGQHIRIYVPSGLDEIKVTNGTGSFDMEDFTVGQGDITVTTGSINIEECTFDSLRVKSTTGSVHLEECTFGTLNATATTGSVRINDCVSDEITAEANTGSVRLSSVKARYINAAATTGSVRVEVRGDRNDYDIKSSTSTGSNNAGNQDRDGDKKIILRATTGSIQLSFV